MVFSSCVDDHQMNHILILRVCVYVCQVKNGIHHRVRFWLVFSQVKSSYREFGHRPKINAVLSWVSSSLIRREMERAIKIINITILQWYPFSIHVWHGPYATPTSPGLAWVRNCLSLLHSSCIRMSPLYVYDVWYIVHVIRFPYTIGSFPSPFPRKNAHGNEKKRKRKNIWSLNGQQNIGLTITIVLWGFQTSMAWVKMDREQEDLKTNLKLVVWVCVYFVWVWVRIS